MGSIGFIGSYELFIRVFIGFIGLIRLYRLIEFIRFGAYREPNPPEERRLGGGLSRTGSRGLAPGRASARWRLLDLGFKGLGSFRDLGFRV